MIVNLVQFFRHPGGRATGIIFALCGFIFGTWASFIPYVKEKFLLDEAQLGILLLCMPIGTLIANPLSVWVIARWGAVQTSMLSIVSMGILFSIPILAPTVIVAGIGLILSGASFAFTNVTMNTCASYLERGSSLRLMAACHGMWSLGAMSGSLLSGTGIVLLGLISTHWIDAYQLYMGILMAGTFLVAYKIRRDLQQVTVPPEDNYKKPISGKALFRPNRILWILISISLCTYLVEGTMADWSAVFMRDIIQAPVLMIGWGFGLYAFFMAAGRFVGDSLIARFGNITMLMAGGIMAIAGLIIIIFSGEVWIALPGFMLTGLGISTASPILYAAAARVPDLPPGAGLATMNSFGMAAFLGGPVLIGFVAKALDLRIAFMVVALAALLWVIQTIVIRRYKINP